MFIVCYTPGLEAGRRACPGAPPYLLEERLCVGVGGLCGARRAVIVRQRGVLEVVFLGLSLSLLLLLLLFLRWFNLALKRFSFPWG